MSKKRQRKVSGVKVLDAHCNNHCSTCAAQNFLGHHRPVIAATFPWFKERNSGPSSLHYCKKTITLAFFLFAILKKIVNFFLKATRGCGHVRCFQRTFQYKINNLEKRKAYITMSKCYSIIHSN